jgi:Na+/H+-dicarboxylate symporter
MDVLLTLIFCVMVGFYLLWLDERKQQYYNSLEQETRP